MELNRWFRIWTSVQRHLQFINFDPISNFHKLLRRILKNQLNKWNLYVLCPWLFKIINCFRLQFAQFYGPHFKYIKPEILKIRNWKKNLRNVIIFTDYWACLGIQQFLEVIKTNSVLFLFIFICRYIPPRNCSTLYL